MRRTAQAVAIVALVFLSAAVGFVAGVALMAQAEAPAPVANRWERAI